MSCSPSQPSSTFPGGRAGTEMTSVVDRAHHHICHTAGDSLGKSENTSVYYRNI